MKEKKIKLNEAQSKFFIESLLPELIKIAKRKNTKETRNTENTKE